MTRSLCTIIVAACLPVTGTVPLRAQELSPTPESTSTAPVNQKGGQGLMKQLNLTPDQRSQIKQIRQTTTDKKARRQAILKVLTPEQQAKWKTLRAEKRAAQAAQ